MKVGYPDTMNSAAAASPMKARYASSGELDDLQAVEVKKGIFSDDPPKDDSPAEYKETPINMITPIKAREMSAKRRARRGKRVERIDAKANSIAEQKYLKGVAEEDLPTTAKKGKVKKYDRLTKKSDRISAKTTKILRDNNQVPSARKKPKSKKSGDVNYKKADRLSKRVDRLDKKLEKSGVKKTKGGSYTGSEGYTGDSRREIRLRKQDRKAGAAAGYGNMDEAKSTAKLDKTLAKKGYKRTPVKSTDIIGGFRADRKAAAEKAKKAEDAIRQSQSSSKPTATTTKKKSILAKRKERRAENNPKVKARQEGRAARKEQRQTRRDDVKDQKSQITKARNTRKTARITKEDNRKKGNVQAKVQSKLTRINEKTAKIKEDKTKTVQASKDKKTKQLKGSIGFSRKSIGLKTNEQRAKERAKRKEEENSPTKFASNAQRKAVWASKNEKKKNK